MQLLKITAENKKKTIHGLRVLYCACLITV